MHISNNISQLHSMYPSSSWLLSSESFNLPKWARHCSVYGYSYGDTVLVVDGKTLTLEKGQYFGLSVSEEMSANVTDRLFLVCRLGYRVPNTIGWVEKRGRLSYIDGCSDTLLVYPARLGDCSLNFLYFPPGVEQTFHIHPSFRLGCVIDGQGFSNYGESNNIKEDTLSTGTSFCLEEQERHRFRTVNSSMTVIAFHPDGDWGPTDHNHTMMNRTYLDK